MIQVTNVHKSFGDKTVFRGLDLHVEEGEQHVVIGRSGEGKSVLLKHLCGLMRADSGEVRVAGFRLYEDKRSLMYVRRKVSMVFQMAALFDSMTVYENVGFYWLENKGKTIAEIDRLVAELLELVDMPNTEALYPSELSGGMRKRVGLARALAPEPEIILYDEPTTGLDPVTSQVINELMNRVRTHRRITSLVITHDMRSAYEVGDRVSMLHGGRIVFTGTPDEIRTSDDGVVHQFVNGLATGPITSTEEEQVRTRASLLVDRGKLHI